MDGEGNKFVGPIVHRTDDHRLKSELNVELTYDEAKTVEKLRRNLRRRDHVLHVHDPQAGIGVITCGCRARSFALRGSVM